jgi:hypothetical protein
MLETTTNTLAGSMVAGDAQTWRPNRPVAPLSGQSMQLEIDAIRVGMAGILSTVDNTPAITTTTPTETPATLQVTNVSAVESPYKVQSTGQMMSLVAIDYTPDPADTNFGSVEIWFTGYNGADNPQLMAQGNESPVEFLCETTHEMVTVTVVAVSGDGVPADFSVAPTTTVALDGEMSPPPAPSIASAQVALVNNSGWQFAFNVIRGLETDLIEGYWVYHSESNLTPTTTDARYQYIKQSATNIGQVVVQEVTGDVLFYWVSAVSVSGQESFLTPVPFTYVDPGDPAPPTPQPVTTTSKTGFDVSLNGWASGGHVGYYEQIWQQHSQNNQACNPYSGATNVSDGNDTTAATASMSHSAQYFGCIWTPKAITTTGTITSLKINVCSDCFQTSGPFHGEAGIWYSLDSGSTWQSLYIVSGQTRAKKYDTITLSSSQDLSKVQIMAMLHSHDDGGQEICELNVEATITSAAGPQNVSGVTATLVGGNVQISWPGLLPLTRTDIIDYEVYRTISGGGYLNSHLHATRTCTGASSYSWTDPEGHDGTWEYYVVAKGQGGYSAPSGVVKIHSATAMIYSDGQVVSALQPAESNAERTTGKSIDILSDGSTYARVKNTHVSNGLIRYANGTGLDSLQPLEGGAEKTTGKSIDILTDGSTFKRVSATHVAAGGALQYTTGELIQSLKPAQAGADVTAGKSIDVLTDGSSYARVATSRVNAGRPVIDFSETIHSNKNLDNVGDGSSGRTAQLVYSFPGYGSNTWTKLGTWAGGAQTSSLLITINAGSGYNTNANQQSVATIQIRSGNQGSAPNLSGATAQVNGNQFLLALKVAATGGNSSSSNSSWDVYVQTGSFSGGHYSVSVAPGQTWTNISSSSSDPGAASSTVVIGTVQNVLDSSGKLYNTLGINGTSASSIQLADIHDRVSYTVRSGGGIDFAYSNHVNKHLGNIPDGGGRYGAAEAGANVTSAHAITATASPSAASTTLTTTLVAITAFGFSMNTSNAGDVYNLSAVLDVFAATNGVANNLTIELVLDGNTASPLITRSWSNGYSGYIASIPFFASINGLSAGSHTLQFYMKATNGSVVVYNTSYCICQRIY